MRSQNGTVRQPTQLFQLSFPSYLGSAKSSPTAMTIQPTPCFVATRSSKQALSAPMTFGRRRPRPSTQIRGIHSSPHPTNNPPRANTLARDLTILTDVSMRDVSQARHHDSENELGEGYERHDTHTCVFIFFQFLKGKSCLLYKFSFV